MAIPVIAYIRVSRVGGREGDSFLSPDLQREACEREAERNGLRIIDTYEELDASGGDSRRPLWNKAIERVERGEARGLVVWNLSRFSRSTVDALTALERIENAGGVLYSASGDVGDSTPSGKLTRTVFLGLAQMERERARDGFAVSQRAAIERGVPVAAHTPLGYTRDPDTRRYLIDPRWAPVIRGVFERRAQGWSFEKIAAWFVEQGGDPNISPHVLRQRVANKTYLGWARHGEKVNKNAHEPVVSQRLFDAANAKKGRQRPHTGKLASQTLLGGVVRCNSCGYVLSIGGVRGKAMYACKRFSCTARAAAKSADLDREVLLRVWAYVAKEGTMVVSRATPRRDLDEMRKALEDAQYDRKLFIENRELRRLLSAEEYAGELHSLNEAVQELQMAVAMEDDSPEIEINQSSLTEMWNAWTQESRREWLSNVLDKVVLSSAKRRRIPVADRLHVTLRSITTTITVNQPEAQTLRTAHQEPL